MPARSLPALFAPLLTALAVAACGSVEQAMIERGFPPAYAEGYADGCASGKEAAGGLIAQARKDTRRYGADDQYTAGWDEGFAQCRRDMAAMVWHARVRNRNRDK
jgi:flagellar biosynthesis/type III secretory pathway protein FliH